MNVRYLRLPIKFGDVESQEAYERQLTAAAKAQTVPMAVAPRCLVILPDGRRIGAGQEITWDMFRDDPAELWKHLGCSRVIEWDSPPPEAA